MSPTRRRRLAALVFPTIVLSACADDIGWSSSSCSSSATFVEGGAIAMGAVKGTIDTRFSLEVIGQGRGRIGAIGLTENQGQVVIQGAPLAALVYQRTVISDYEVYQAIAVGSDGWCFLWLYCLGGNLTGVWTEGTNGALIREDFAFGRCAIKEAPTTVAVDFPASRVDTTLLRCGADVTGPDISIHDGMGTYAFLGDTFSVLVIGTIDCSNCDGDGYGWFELHSLLWNPATRDLGFAVIYLSGTSTQIQMRAGHGGSVSYWLSLPSLRYVEGNPVSIDWSLTPP